MRSQSAGRCTFSPNVVDFSRSKPFAWGDSYQLGVHKVYIDGVWGHLSMTVHQVPLNAEVKVWKDDGLCEAPSDALTFKPNFMTANDKGLAMTSVYLTSAQIARFGLEPGNKLAFQLSVNGKPSGDVTLVPVLSEKQVFPGRVLPETPIH